MDEDQEEEEMIEEILTKKPANKRLHVPWGIQPKEVVWTHCKRHCPHLCTTS
jgi:hypothetical protein